VKQKKLRRSAPEDYSEKEAAELKECLMYLRRTEGAMRLANTLWRQALLNAVPVNMLLGHRVMQRIKWEKRRARISLRKVQLAYFAAVERPVVMKEIRAALLASAHGTAPVTPHPEPEETTRTGRLMVPETLPGEAPHD